ncbi:PepSY domain-containing protein [Chryseomicrobium aureum]|uniref:PepSY domain-containing protein n=1 Tax=Chryseomicrobium aureum TaxID=1441723 RepID=UPI00370D8FDD
MQKKPWFIPLLLTGIILIGSIFYFQVTTAGEEPMTRTEIQEQLERMYSGTITNLELSGESYRAQLETDDGFYTIEANARYGTVVSIVQTEQKQAESSEEEQQPEQVEPEPEETPTEEQEPVEQAPTRLTEEQVSEIALQQVSGTVADVDFEQSESGGYYLVEIEQPDQGDEDGPEATVQIHAITGEVLSVVWDD